MRKAAALLMAVVLTTAACGGDDATTTTAPPATMAPAGTPGDTPGGTPGFGDAGSCVQLSLALSQAAGMGMTGTGSLEDSIAALEAMGTAVPPNVAADFAIMAAALTEFSAALQAAGVNMTDPASMGSPAAQQAIASASEAFEQSGASEASDRIGDFMESECGNG